MKYIMHDKGYDPKCYLFEERKEAEEFLWRWILDAVDIDELKEYDPEEAQRLLSGPEVIYDMEYDWGEDNAWVVNFFEVTGRGVRTLIPKE